ncbi:6-phosphogluconolactonase [Thozetella sp. PMI_491]|nr:6-phosphogluconolactonase [Thozetella sp. PMI_491]
MDDCGPVPPAQAAGVATLLVGGGPTGLISLVEFDGTKFTTIANNTEAGTSASWQLFRPNSTQLYAVDENSGNTRLFNIDAQTKQITKVQDAAGSTGVVFLEFNKDRTRMAGAAFGNSTLDFWDVSSPDGTLKLLKTIAVPTDVGPVTDRQAAPHPHQILLDPSGRFFVANDLGTDRVLVVDSLDDKFELTNSIKVPKAGAGPRHAAFFPPGADKATHYILLQEILSLIQVYKLDYVDNTINFTPTQEISSFGNLALFGPANSTTASAGEIQITPDGKDIYVSNRLTGNATDSLAHFAVVQGAGGDITLEFRDTVSSGGLIPRMFSLGLDAFSSTLFATNQGGASGLLAFTRDASGALSPQPAASVALDVFAPAGTTNGPQFVQQIFL